MNNKDKNALDGCTKCENGHLEHLKDLHESSLGYREVVDEIWKCDSCGAEFKIVREPIIKEEVDNSINIKELVKHPEEFTIVNQTDDIEVWLLDDIIENENNGKKYRVALVFRFINEDYSNCKAEIHMIPENPSDDILNKAKYLLGLEKIDNNEIRKKKGSMYSMLIDADYSHVYFSESYENMRSLRMNRKDKLNTTLNQVVIIIEGSHNPPPIDK
jgi:DNA-directed RNA polymerase subunit M/transcription elongation factor TFIIS